MHSNAFCHFKRSASAMTGTACAADPRLSAFAMRFLARSMRSLATLCAVLVATCVATHAQAPARPPLTIFAAASLKTALDALTDAAKAATGHPVRLVYAATPQLARQIEQGAPADVFMSADSDWMDYLAARGRIIPASRTDLLGNRLVLVAHGQTAIGTLPLTRDGMIPTLGLSGRLALADVNAVPAGRYAKAALTSLGLWDDVASRLAMADNVRVALTYVARREAPLGIVYASDAMADPGVRVVATFPFTSHPPIVYPAAAIAGRPPEMERAGAAFLAFLRSPAALAIFTANGFIPLPPR